MDLLLPLLLASLVSAEELRFSAAPEQGSESGCGPAAAAGLLSLYCGRPATEAGLTRGLAGPGGASLGELLALFPAAGLEARAFRLGLPELDEALARGFGPALLHYDRPKGHYALLLGGREGIYVAADPARGLESLSAGELEARWSGAAILLDPSALSPEGRALREAALERGLLKRRLLRETALGAWGGAGGGGGEGEGEGEALAPASGREGGRERVGFRGIQAWSLGLGLNLELEALEAGFRLGLGLDQELRLGSGLSFGLDLPLEAGLGAEPSYLLPGNLGLRLGFARGLGPWLLGARLGLELPTGLGLSGGLLRPGGGLGLGLGLDAARILDPASLGASLDLGLGLPGREEAYGTPPRFSLGLGLSATEALNEKLYLRLRAGLGWAWSREEEVTAAAELGGVVGLRLGSFGASLGASPSRGGAGGPPLSLGLSWEFEGARSRRERAGRDGKRRRGHGRRDPANR